MCTLLPTQNTDKTNVYYFYCDTRVELIDELLTKYLNKNIIKIILDYDGYFFFNSEYKFNFIKFEKYIINKVLKKYIEKDTINLIFEYFKRRNFSDFLVNVSEQLNFDIEKSFKCMLFLFNTSKNN